MTTLATGLPISSRASETKITPALRLAVQKASSVFQKDFCYDFIQAIVDEPEIADPIGVRLFLNFCLRQPDNLVDSFLDSIDQNLGSSPESLTDSADPILNEVENFIEFIHGLIEMIDGGEVFKLAYHEIDAWKLCSQLLEPIQHRLFDLAVQDRELFTSKTRDSSNGSEPPELTFASDSTSSGFYHAFVSIDKFLKHSLESRILLEPAKLVEDGNQLNERRKELQTFRALFPSTHNSTLLANKKHGRFGREEAILDQFLESDKFKELSKLKSTMSGGQLTRQPSTRTKKSSKPSNVNDKDDSETKQSSPGGSPTNPVVLGGATKNKRTIFSGLPAVNNVGDPDPTKNLDPFIREGPALEKPVLTNKRLDESDADSENDTSRHRKKTLPSAKPISKADSSTSSKKQGSTGPSTGARMASTPPVAASATASSTKRKRSSRSGNHVEKEGSVNSSSNHSATKRTRRPRKSSKASKSNNHDDDNQEEEEELYKIDKIIGESVDVNGEVIYKVLWAGYPESEATWQFANTLDDCEALDVWLQNKLTGTAPDHDQQKAQDGNHESNKDESTNTKHDFKNDPNKHNKNDLKKSKVANGETNGNHSSIH